MNRRGFLFCMATALTAGCLGGRAGRLSSNASLRVLTYNLHHGEGVDGKVDLARLAGVIRNCTPDLVALQEVDRRAQRTGSVDQAAELARLTGLHGWYGAAMPFQGGEYGQCLLSRWPLQEPKVVRLPGSRGREPRIAVTALVGVPGMGTIRWVGLHLDASRDDLDRWAQAGALLEAFGSEAHPCLMAGDFNATPESRVMHRLLDPATGWLDTAGHEASPTIPAEAPTSRIDYVLAHPGPAWRTASSQVVSEAVASDHRPLCVTLQATTHH